MKKVSRIKLLLVMGIIVLGPVLLVVVSYLSHGQTTCIYDAIGISCLGCNGLSALYALKQGRILVSLRHNPFILLWIGIGTILIIDEIYIYLRRCFNRGDTRESFIDQLIKGMFRGINFKEE